MANTRRRVESITKIVQRWIDAGYIRTADQPGGADALGGVGEGLGRRRRVGISGVQLAAMLPDAQRMRTRTRGSRTTAPGGEDDGGNDGDGVNPENDYTQEMFELPGGSEVVEAVVHGSWTITDGAAVGTPDSTKTPPALTQREGATYTDGRATITTASTGSSRGALVYTRGKSTIEGWRGYAFRVSGFVGQLVRYDTGGTVTVLGTSGGPWAAGTELAIEAEGTTIRAFRNGVERVSVTDATFASGRMGYGYVDNFNTPGIAEFIASSDVG